jgi:hypothetical protein
MPHLYTDTAPRMPRVQKKRGLLKTIDYAERLKEKAEYESRLRRQVERQLRVLLKVRFALSDQTESVRKSLQLINHTSP